MQPTEQTFYQRFRDKVIDAGEDMKDENERRICFILHHYEMIPKDHEQFIFNLGRSYPAPPIYLFLALGILGTNIARFCSVSRPGCHKDQSERTGTFYKLIGESRLGKGLAMNVLQKLGKKIEKMRMSTYSSNKEVEEAKGDGSHKYRKRLEVRLCTSLVSKVFITGANAIQVQTEAGRNAGCGIIFVPEIKRGKTKYTDVKGTYGPLLTFYDTPMAGKTFRTAEVILDVPNCRLQLIAAGVPGDQSEFVEQSGHKSGTLARVIPVVGWDREMVRIQQNKLTPYSQS